MRDLVEAGLDIENCEPWFERAAVVIVGLMAVVLVVRVSVNILSMAIDLKAQLRHLASVRSCGVKLLHPDEASQSEVSLHGRFRFR